jgi:hypothetical protein
MNWRTFAILAVLGFALSFGIAQFQRFPGYLDSDYYFAGGLQLSSGRGFTEPYLWNYLDDPQGLPHPSHTYWMPLSSMIAALGLWMVGDGSYASGRIGFLLLAAVAPVVTAALAHRFTQRADLAMVSGLLAVFAVYYAPFMPVTDNYGPYVVLGGLYFIVMGWQKRISYLLLGMISGLLALARSDGLLWYALTCLLIIWRYLGERGVKEALARFAMATVGFGIVAGPWFLHTYAVYGTALAPGSGHLLWLKNYDETFLFPAGLLTFKAWLAQGLMPIMSARLFALRWNLLNAFAAQGEIFLLPFILMGMWTSRRDERVRLALIAWGALLTVMTIIFPFAGARGGFFHAGAALQPMWWVLAPLGLDGLVVAARRRNMFTPQALKIFQGALVGLAVLMTAVILWIRVLPGWGEGEGAYPKVESFLRENGAGHDDIVMVRNPPGYYLMTGRSAIVVPYGDEASMDAVAQRYGARYLIIEAAGAAGPIKSVYDSRSSQRFAYLGNVDGTHVYRVLP